jgi:hypothetical protein
MSNYGNVFFEFNFKEDVSSLQQNESPTKSTALMTVDAGNPDGDIVQLQTSNTVNIVTV